MDTSKGMIRSHGTFLLQVVVLLILGQSHSFDWQKERASKAAFSGFGSPFPIQRAGRFPWASRHAGSGKQGHCSRSWVAVISDMTASIARPALFDTCDARAAGPKNNVTLPGQRFGWPACLLGGLARLFAVGGARQEWPRAWELRSPVGSRARSPPRRWQARGRTPSL